MRAGNTGIRALHGLIGTSGSNHMTCNLRGLTGYRRLMYTRRLHVGWRQLRLRDPKRSCTLQSKLSGNASVKHHGLGKTSTSIWIFLVGQGRHIQALEELKELARVLLRLVTRQFEVQTAERIRRGLQLYSAYSRLWGEEAAKLWLKSIRRLLITKGKRFLLSAVCFSNYNWDANKISDESLRSAVRDLNSVEELCKATVQCECCGKRQVIDQQMSNIDYCMCGGELGYTNTSRVYDSWEPFIERAHHIVWRKKHEVHQHLYAYKVYGTYDDVCLSAFMEVQLNSDFRTEWDDTALQLRVLDSQKESNSDLIYWLVKYSHFFADRDYIYKRRFLWDEEKQEAVILNEAVSLDNVPEEKGVHRVSEYWSTMVIRAKEDASKPGLEYTLTYFDNPGTSLPQWLTNFIAVTGFPSFLQKVHEAAVSLQAVHEEGKDVYISLPEELRYPSISKLEKPSLKEPAVLDIVSEDLRPDIIEEAPEVVGMSKPSEVPMLLLEDSKTKKLEGIDTINEVPSITIEASESKAEVESYRPPVDQLLEREERKELEEVETFHKDTEEKEVLEKYVPEEKEVHLLDELKVNEEIVKPGDEICTELENEEKSIADRFRPGDEMISKSKKIEPSPSKKVSTSNGDKSLHVKHGSKVVEIDILEGMEVMAPDLDEKTALSKNVEKFTLRAIEELESKEVLVKQLKYIKRKFKLFKEHAVERKETSMKKMEELETRSRYEALDNQTQKHLERLFDAMREVLQADKEMRTGKGLLSRTPVGSEEEEPQNEGGLDTRDPCNPTSPVRPVEKTSDGERSDSPDKKKSKAKGDTSVKEPKSPDEPPPTPPSQPSGSADLAGSVTGSECAEEVASSEVETYNGIDTVVNDQQNNISYHARKPWLSIPYAMGWWESKKEKAEEEVIPSTIGEENVDLNVSENYLNGIVSHVWYFVGLGWIMGTKPELCAEDKDLSEENILSNVSNSSDKEENFNWYWYPVSGAYRLYVWAFRSSKENA
ncbi:uncharacterized protein [Palaemon carinicauda]|uniref:uncharacterized protein n=1 Tax=Palaemon carinicauda TaxID=392227 RepID=UPI0035B678C3